MRIVHAANYSLTRDGTEFFNCEFKFHNGLAQAGHYVYPFSINDRARASNIFRTKNLGRGFANKALTACCRNVEPDLLLLGHAQLILPETLRAIRKNHPDIKVALWYVDPVYPPHPYEHLTSKLPYLDAVFITTGGEWLKPFNRHGCRAAFIPNPADINVERCHVDELSRHECDMIYIGSDKNRPERRLFLSEFAGLTKDLRVGFAACLGYPPVWGTAKDAMLKNALTALNLSDRNDIPLYSSDRIVQLAGNGICTFSAAESGLQALYEPDKEMVFFSDVKDLAEKVRHYAAHPDQARAIGRAGRLKTHTVYSGQAVADFMCAFTLNESRWKNVFWRQFCL